MARPCCTGQHSLNLLLWAGLPFSTRLCLGFIRVHGEAAATEAKLAPSQNRVVLH